MMAFGEARWCNRGWRVWTQQTSTQTQTAAPKRVQTQQDGKKRFPAATTLAGSRIGVPCLVLAMELARSSAVLPLYFPISLHLGLRRPRIMPGTGWIVSVSKQFAAYKTCFYPPCAFRRCPSRTFRRTPCLTNPLSLTLTLLLSHHTDIFIFDPKQRPVEDLLCHLRKRPLAPPVQIPPSTRHATAHHTTTPHRLPKRDTLTDTHTPYYT
jgi:hypothetical protein